MGFAAGRQSDKILVDLKFSIDRIVSRSLTKVQCYYSVVNAFQLGKI